MLQHSVFLLILRFCVRLAWKQVGSKLELEGSMDTKKLLKKAL